MAIDSREKRHAAAFIANWSCTPLPVTSALWDFFNRGAAGYVYLPASLGEGGVVPGYKMLKGVGN